MLPHKTNNKSLFVLFKKALLSFSDPIKEGKARVDGISTHREYTTIKVALSLDQRSPSEIQTFTIFPKWFHLLSLQIEI